MRNERMAEATSSKLWFLDRRQFHEVDVVFDVGCGDGTLLEAMRESGKVKNSVLLVGIDSDPNQRESTREKGFAAYPDLKTAIDDFNFPVKNAGIVLSSVLHEMLTFDPASYDELMETMENDDRFAYAFVRDMCPMEYDDRFDEVLYHTYNGDEACREFIDADRFKYAQLSKSLIRDARNEYNARVDFLLHQQWPDNWENEKEERYLWEEIRDLCSIDTSQFYVPYVEMERNLHVVMKVIRNTGIAIPSNLDTHVRAVLSLR